jgi:hypothetical protein
MMGLPNQPIIKTTVGAIPCGCPNIINSQQNKYCNLLLYNNLIVLG